MSALSCRRRQRDNADLLFVGVRGGGQFVETGIGASWVSIAAPPEQRVTPTTWAIETAFPAPSNFYKS